MKRLVELFHIGFFVIVVTGVLFATDQSNSAVGTRTLNVEESK